MNPVIPDALAKWLEQYSLLDAAITILAVWAALTVTWRMLKKWWPGLLIFIEFVKAIGRLPVFMGTTESFMVATESKLANHSELLAIVKHEVLPNNGGSMRDDQTTMGMRMEKIEAKLSKDHERFSVLEENIKVREATRRAANVLTPGGLPDHSEETYADSFNPYPVHDPKGD